MDDSALLLTLKSYQPETRVHQHDFHQLVLPVQGVLKLEVDNDGGRVDGGHAAVIAAGREHAFEADVDNRFIVADLPEALAPELEKLPAFVDLDGAMVQYICFLHQQLREGRGSRNPLLQRQMLLLLVQLLDQRHGGESVVDRRVCRARVWLERHFAEEVSMSQLAAVASLSERRLRELFCRSYGMPPSRYLTELRMQAALKLLQSSDLSIQRVAEQVGYANIPAFSDRFRRHFGHSPRHFRRTAE